MELEEVNYYSIGTPEKPVISSSSLGSIDPKQGGSPVKFQDFFRQGEEEKQSVSLERGSLVHLWHEHQDRFIISDVEKPSDMMCDWVNKVYNVLAPSGLENYSRDLVLALGDGFYKSTKDEAKRFEKFTVEGYPYLNFLFKADGKVCMTPATKNIVEGCITAINNNDVVCSRLFSEPTAGQERLKELEVFWHLPNMFAAPLDFKAKLDNVLIDFDKKIVYLNDLKTTSSPVSQFDKSFKSYRYYRQLAFYRIAINQYLNQLGLDFKQFTIQEAIIAVDYTAHFGVDLVIPDAPWRLVGQREIRELCQRLAWHVKNNHWTTPMELAKNGFTSISYTEKDKLLGYEL